MKTHYLHLVLSLSFLLLCTCNNSPKIDYKYAKNSIPCTNSVNADALKEALFSFEDDIRKFPAKQTNDQRAYAQMSRYILADRAELPIEKISEHSIKVFEVLKQEKDLWVKTNDRVHLNYNHPLVTCIGENIQDENLKTTFNALLSTNSMSSALIGPVIRTKLSTALNDKALATFIALDTYYTRFFRMDFSRKAEAQNTVENNTTQPQPALQTK